MDAKQLDYIVHETVNSISSLMLTKGHEYASGVDRLENFKRGALLSGATPLTVLLIYLSKHYDAFATYVKKDAAKIEQKLSEPIEGRLDDMINYCILAKAILAEQRIATGSAKAEPDVTTYTPEKQAS